MNTSTPVRTAGVTAVLAAAGQIIATVLEPDWSGAAETAMPVLAGSEIWLTDRVLDLVSLLATVFALTVFAQMFTDRARDRLRIGQPFLVMLGALGSAAILVVGSLKTVAQQGSSAEPVFKAIVEVASALFFGAFLVMGVYAAFLAAAIVVGDAFPRWIGRALWVSAVCLAGGSLFMLVNDLGFVVVLAGLGLFNLMLVALGVSAWRKAGQASAKRARPLVGSVA